MITHKLTYDSCMVLLNSFSYSDHGRQYSIKKIDLRAVTSMHS
jgi:hypothetical protein